MNEEKTKMELLDIWLNELAFPGNKERYVTEISGSGDANEIRREFCFYTKDHRYTISAMESDTKNYLGCTVSARKSVAGETWHRGNDLPDGSFTRKTWNKIINSIVSYELVKLSDKHF